MNALAKNMISILKAALFHLLNILIKKKPIFPEIIHFETEDDNYVLELPCNTMMAMANKCFHLLIISTPLKAAPTFLDLNQH